MKSASVTDLARDLIRDLEGSEDNFDVDHYNGETFVEFNQTAQNVVEKHIQAAVQTALEGKLL